MDGKNFEHKARLYRYNILYKYAEIYNINTILTAHHYDDQIETLFMMKYIYKASWVSMMGIRENNNKLSRPLLKIKKDELYKYANKNNLLWIEDETNKDITFLRNKVRHHLLPSKRKKNLSIDLKLLKEANNSKKKFAIISDDIAINIKLFTIKNNKSCYSINNNILRKYNINDFKLFYQIFLKKFNINTYASFSHWNNLYRFLKDAKSGAKFYLNSEILILMDRKYHFILLTDYYKCIKRLKKIEKIKMSKSPIRLFNNATIEKNANDYNITIPLSDKNKDIFIRYWRPGDFCFLDFYKSNVKLKKIFINNKLSIIDKLTIPIFVNSNDEIVSIPNIFNYNLTNDSLKLKWTK